MTSESGGPQGITDDRLAEARDSILADGETIVAQEEGDQGQGIVLTNARVLIIRVGGTATGTANGRIIGDFPIKEITAVHLRRGPLGAVIQVCTARVSASPGPGAPDNVIAFTGQLRVKKCEAMAASIEKVIPRAPAEATAQEKPRGGREPRSLAEEMFGEPAEPSPTPSPARTEPAAAASPALESTGQESASEPEEEINAEPNPCEFQPNPNLPSPAKADRSGARKMLVLLGLLLAALLVGTAVTAPLRAPDKKRHSVELNVEQLTNNSTVAQKRLAVVADFESRLTGIFGELTPSLAVLQGALRSSNRAAVTSALRGNAADKAWQRVSSTQAPPGLTGARETIISGLFAIRGAVANVSTGVQSSAPLNTQQALSRISDGLALTKKGLDSIRRMHADLSKQVAKSSPAPAGKKMQPR